MKRLALAILGMFLFANSSVVFAISPSSIVISAVQTESATSASEEYITVHNSGSSLIDVTGWRLQYFAATAANFTSPTRTITLSGTLAPGTNLTVSSTGYTAQSSTIFFAATLSATGGHIRLVSGATPNEVVHDLVGWGTAQFPEQAAVDVVARGTAYRRNLTNGQPVDTDNNYDDFTTPPVVVIQQPADPLPSVPQPATNANPTYAGLTITELLPDPATPFTDASDEFIELYNDSLATIDLAGATLQTGNSNTYSYKLTGTIGAHSYLLLYSSQTKLTLSNAGGRSQIIDAAGAVIDETAAYGAAPTGSSWQLFNNEWSWSYSVTAGVANTPPPAGTVTTPKVKAATTTKAATKAKTATAAAAKTTKAVTNKASTASGAGQLAAASQPSPINKSVLLGVGLLALGYVIYEYRYDIAQKYRRLRGNAAAGPKDSPQP